MFERLGAGVVPAMVFLVCLLGFVVFCFLLTLDNDVAYEHGKFMVAKDKGNHPCLIKLKISHCPKH